jgi:hypothetical protein
MQQKRLEEYTQHLENIFNSKSEVH